MPPRAASAPPPLVHNPAFEGSASAPMDSIAASYPKTDQEARCEVIFSELDKQFKKLDKCKKPDKIHAMLREITQKLKEAKA